MRTRDRRIVVTLLSLVLLTLVGASPAAARPALTTANLFGAIAVEPQTHAYGFGYNYDTRTAAQNRAMHECRIRADVPSNCRVMVWVRNGCAAVAYKHKPTGGWRYGWGIAATKALAKQRARDAVGPNALNLVWVCTG